MDLSPSSTSALITSVKLCGCFAFIFRAHTHSHTVSEAAQLSPETQFWFCAVALLVDAYIFHSDSLLYRVITQLLLGLWVQVQGFSLCNLLEGSRIRRCSSVFFFSMKAAPNIALSLELFGFLHAFHSAPPSHKSYQWDTAEVNTVSCI